MPRTVETVANTALKSQPTRYIWMADIAFTTPVYVHTGPGAMEIDFNGNIYRGLGTFADVSEVFENGELQAWNLTATLSGIDTNLFGTALLEPVQGRAFNLYIQMLNDQLQPTGDPIGPWGGQCDYITGELGNTGVLALHVNHAMADWDRPNLLLYSDADQQRLFPGDLFFDAISTTVEVELQWGPFQ